MDFGAIFKLKQAWETFAANHPKFPGFIENVKNKPVCENMEIAIAIRYPDGCEYKTGIKVKQSDLELLENLKKMN